MTPTSWTWLLLAALYAAFFAWYTPLGGPLSPEEVDHYMALLRESDSERTPEAEAILREFLEGDTGDDFVMWNNVHMRDSPLVLEGVGPGETSDEVLGRYMEYMLPALFARACHPVLLGRAAGRAPEMFGIEGVRHWTRGAAMRYRSRRDLMEIATNPAFSGAHDFKVAAIAKTFAFPLDPWFQLADPRLLLALVLLVVGLAVHALRRA